MAGFAEKKRGDESAIKPLYQVLEEVQVSAMLDC